MAAVSGQPSTPNASGPNLIGSQVISPKVKSDRLSTVKSPEQRAAFRNSRNGYSWHRRWPGRGWTVAHDRRMARKRRNVAKARRAGRG